MWQLDLPKGQGRISIFFFSSPGFSTLKTFYFFLFLFLTESKKGTTSTERRKNKQTQEKTKQNKTFDNHDNNCSQSTAKTNNVSLESEEKLSLLTLLIYKKT